MRFTRLKHVVQVDRSGSISAAAANLHTTQSSVTKSLAAMEQELGYALFERKARGVTPTEKGRAFLNRAAHILSDYERLIEDSREDRAAATALFRIGVCPALLQGLLNHAICTVIAQYPAVRIQLHAVSPERGIELLNRGDLDILVGPLDAIGGEAEFRYEQVAAIEAGLYVRKGHPLDGKAEVTREDIRAYPFIATDLANAYTDKVVALLKEDPAADPLRQLHIVGYYPIIAEIVQSTDAVSVISRRYAASRTFRKRFRLLDLDIFDHLEMGCAWRTHWEPSRIARQFITALKA